MQVQTYWQNVRLVSQHFYVDYRQTNWFGNTSTIYYIYKRFLIFCLV
jgi:hypothetical protein